MLADMPRAHQHKRPQRTRGSAGQVKRQAKALGASAADSRGINQHLVIKPQS